MMGPNLSGISTKPFSLFMILIASITATIVQTLTGSIIAGFGSGVIAILLLSDIEHRKGRGYIDRFKHILYSMWFKPASNYQ